MPSLHPLVARGRKLVEESRPDWPDVAEEARVSVSWLYKFSQGKIPNPTIDSLQGVIDACEVVLARPKGKAA